MLADDKELRRIRLEARANLEEAEAAVGEVAAASRSMIDIIGDLGRLGVSVAVDVPGRQIHGRIIHVGVAMCQLQTPGEDVFDIAVAAIAGIRSSGESLGPAKIGKGHPDTLISRCRELAVNQDRITLARYFGSELVGNIMIAGVNHIQLEDNQSKMWFVPIKAVAWIGPPH